MKLKDEVWTNCECCGKRKDRISDEIYGCDSCGKVIDMNKKGIEYLSSTVFTNSSEMKTKEYVFCSWKCCLEKMSKVKTDYFINLPYLTFDNRSKGVMAKDFWNAVKNFK
jgi:hypothetical protein